MNDPVGGNDSTEVIDFGKADTQVFTFDQSLVTDQRMSEQAEQLGVNDPVADPAEEEWGPYRGVPARQIAKDPEPEDGFPYPFLEGVERYRIVVVTRHGGRYYSRPYPVSKWGGHNADISKALSFEGGTLIIMPRNGATYIKKQDIESVIFEGEPLDPRDR